MENISHTLVSLATAVVIDRSMGREADPQQQKIRTRLILTGGAIAGNLPDLDILSTHLIPPPLGYLLLHRGYSHTVLYLLPQLLLLLLLLWVLWPAARQLLRNSVAARGGLVLAVVAGLVLHLAMDYLNVYGVHPWAPFDRRWLYGDSVFIVEPVFWALCGAPLAALLPKRWLSRAALLFLLILPAGFCLTAYLRWWSALSLMIASLLLYGFARTSPLSRQPVALSLLLACAFVAGQFAMASQAREQVRQGLLLANPHQQIMDIALSAFPANPFCWNANSIILSPDGKAYTLQHGLVSLWPATHALQQCPSALVSGRWPANASGHWQPGKTWTYSLVHLRNLVANDCRLAAWMRYARLPMQGNHALEDLRYFRENGNFSRINQDNATLDCASFWPDWGMPRADLLGIPANK